MDRGLAGLSTTGDRFCPGAANGRVPFRAAIPECLSWSDPPPLVAGRAGNFTKPSVEAFAIPLKVLFDIGDSFWNSTA